MKAESHLGLCDPEASVRLAATKRAPASGHSLYLLRNAVLFDRDGRVRALAASRLGAASKNAFIFRAICQAAEQDPLPSVRQAAWRTLARAAKRTPLLRPLGEELGALCRNRLASEPTWWVRTAIAQAVGNHVADARIDDLLAFLADPFWRVRHTAIRALVGLGQNAGQNVEAVRSQIVSHRVRSDVEGAAMLFIQRAWNDERLGELVPNLATEPPSDPLWDPDPAVITANLEAANSKPSIALLIELLADAHESTRRVAAKHIAERDDLREIRAALTWLDETRLPYASAAAVGLAHQLGPRTIDLVASVFDSPPGPGALCWAIGWVGATRTDAFASELEAVLDHRDSRVRREAFGALSNTRPVAAVLARVGDIISAALQPGGAHVNACGAAEAELLAALELAANQQMTSPDGDRGWFRNQPDQVRRRIRRLLTRLARHDGEGESEWLAVAATCDDAQTRAIAIERLRRSGRGSAEQKWAALADDDPLVREAALEPNVAGQLVEDGDPNVRRRALKLAQTVPADAAIRLARSADRFDRIHAARFLTPPTPSTASTSSARRAIETLLLLTVDTDPGVRSAAVTRLDSDEDRTDDIIETVCKDRATNDELFCAAMSRLCRHGDQRARTAIAFAWNENDSDGPRRKHLSVLRMTLDIDITDATETLDLVLARLAQPIDDAKRELTSNAAASRTAKQVSLVRLGQTGISVSPICLSGANELPVGSLHHGFRQGVNTFFWEPGYRNLSTFLRSERVRDQTQVIAGSYHATAAAIETDVDTALRRLQRKSIDVFLIFWVRSGNRLSEEVWTCLEKLKASGKIRAAGFSSHHRDIALAEIEQRPWDVLMLRHSAAHPGAEDELLVECVDRDVGVFGFTSLCYGRLLQPTPAREKTTAPDCYRYTLAQPGINAVLSAPRRFRELCENLTVLGCQEPSERERASMREHGSWVYSRSKDFAALIRRTPRELPRSSQAYQQLFGSGKAVETTALAVAPLINASREGEPS